MWTFEDFQAGERLALGSVTVTEEEVLAFARRYDPQPFHVDRERAAASKFGGLIASGWHTCAMVMRLACDTYLLDAASFGSPGVEKIEWLQPVRPGDTLSAWRTVLEVRPSRSKDDRGSVFSEFEAKNQHGDIVLRMRAWSLFYRRGAVPPQP
jgi:acyl dehydratase